MRLREEQILEGIREALRELEIPHPADLDTRVPDDLGLDSLQRIALVIEIENRFRICLEPEDEERVATIGDLVRIIGAHLDDGARE